MEYRAQIILGTLHCVTVVVGTFVVRLVVKPFTDAFAERSYFPRTLAVYGAWLLLVPLVWVVLSIAMQRAPFRWANKGFSIITELTLLIGLAWLFIHAAMYPCRMTIGNM